MRAMSHHAVSHERRSTVALVACAALPALAAAKLDGARRARRRRPRELPGELPGADAHDGLPGEGRARPRALPGARRRAHRRVVGRARQARPEADGVLRGALRRHLAGGRRRARPRQEAQPPVVAKAPLQQLTDYFGQTVQFPLATRCAIRKGQYVGLTVPTWAPTLQIGLGSDTSWRSSRAETGCLDVTTQFALVGSRTSAFFRCLYKTARLTYSATFIRDRRTAASG